MTLFRRQYSANLLLAVAQQQVTSAQASLWGPLQPVLTADAKIGAKLQGVDQGRVHCINCTAYTVGSSSVTMRAELKSRHDG